MTTPLRFVGVERRFDDVVALAGVDVAFDPGKIYGLVGPNGSGKTTSLKLALGFLAPDAGRVELFGARPDDTGRLRVGYIPETRALPSWGKVVDVATYFAELRGTRRAEARAAAERVVERLGLGPKAHADVSTLSNGQQQRLQVALGLLGTTDLLLADEPLSALDPVNQDLVFDALRQVADDGAAVVVSTHRLREAEHLIDHVVMLAEGHVVLDAPLQQAMEEAFAGTWHLRVADDAGWVDGPDVARVVREEDRLQIELAEGATLAPLLQRAAAAGAPLTKLEAVVPSLHELYLRRVAALGLGGEDAA